MFMDGFQVKSGGDASCSLIDSEAALEDSWSKEVTPPPNRRYDYYRFLTNKTPLTIPNI